MRNVSIILGLPLLVAALLAGRLLQRYAVTGESMLPAYRPGDRLLAEGVSYLLRSPRKTEVVVVRQPGSGNRKDLKRIAAGPGDAVLVRGDRRVLAEGEWFVLGDNLDASTDSRTLGPISRRDILARAWLKY